MNDITQFLYIIDYWVPFPSSEYGGTISLIAQSDTEAFEVLASEDGFPQEYKHLIMKNVIEAQKLPFKEKYPEPMIVDAFTT